MYLAAGPFVEPSSQELALRHLLLQAGRFEDAQSLADLAGELLKALPAKARSPEPQKSTTGRQ